MMKVNKKAKSLIFELGYRYELAPWGKNTHGIMSIKFMDRPNWWIRMWMFIFFGWRFERI